MIFISSIFLAFVAAISPGPNIILTTANSVSYGRRAGLITAFGVLTGVAIWLILLGFGLSFIFANKTLLTIFHIFAGCYLIFISYMIAKLKVSKEALNSTDVKRKFFLESFVLTLLNSEIAVFYGSILSGVFAKTGSDLSLVALLGYLLSFMCVEGFVFVVAALAGSFVRKFIISYIKIIKIVASIGIFYYGVSILWSLRGVVGL